MFLLKQCNFLLPSCQYDDDECASNPCQNGADCDDLVNQFNCTCTAGYDGKCKICHISTLSINAHTCNMLISYN